MALFGSDLVEPLAVVSGVTVAGAEGRLFCYCHMLWLTTVDSRVTLAMPEDSRLMQSVAPLCVALGTPWLKDFRF